MRGQIKRSSARQTRRRSNSSASVDSSDDTEAASAPLGPEAKLLAKLQAQRKADDASSSSLAQTKRPVLQGSSSQAELPQMEHEGSAISTLSPQHRDTRAEACRELQRRPSQRNRAIRFAKFMRRFSVKRSSKKITTETVHDV